MIGKPSDPQTNKRYAIIALLTCLEATLGIITGCLLVLKPVCNKLRAPAKVSNVWGDTDKSCMSGSIPILMRVNHMWLSISGKRSGGQGPESVVPVEKWEVKWRGGQRETKADRNMECKLPHVSKDVDIESAISED